MKAEDVAGKFKMGERVRVRWPHDGKLSHGIVRGLPFTAADQKQYSQLKFHVGLVNVQKEQSVDFHDFVHESFIEQQTTSQEVWEFRETADEERARLATLLACAHPLRVCAEQHLDAHESLSLQTLTH